VFLAFYFLSFVIGYLFLKRFLAPGQRGDWFLFFLAPGCGLAFTSLVLFLNLYFFGRFSLSWSLMAHAVLLMGLLIFSAAGSKVSGESFPEKKLFLTVLGLGLVFLVFHFLKSPYGSGLDAWAIWKLKARFLFYGQWQKIFSPELGFSHQDYPLFYPLSLCWGWLASGGENVISDWMVASVFTLSLAGLLMAALLPINKIAAWVGGLLLVSTPHFTGMGASQYADIVMAYFFLAGVVLLTGALSSRSGRHFFFSGFFLGIGAFVKNEGLLLLLAVLFSSLAGFLFQEGRKNFRHWAILAAGVLPFLSLTFFFKGLGGIPNDLMMIENFHTALYLPRLAQRAELIFLFLWREILRENAWVYAWIFCGLVFVFYFKNLLKSSFFILFLVFFLVNIGYLGVYLMMSWDIGWHLANSLDRVMLHSFPAAIFLSLSVLCDELK
jgi:hypothetical protein